MHTLKILTLMTAFGLIGSATAVEVLNAEPAAPNAAKVLYKSVDKNGNPVFSDIVAPDGQNGSEAIIIPVRQPNTISAPTPDYSRAQQQMFAENAQRQQAKKARRAANAAKKQKLNAAKQAMLDAKKPHDDEWQNTNKNRRFLKSSYHERQRQEQLQYEEKVREIKQQYRQ